MEKRICIAIGGSAAKVMEAAVILDSMGLSVTRSDFILSCYIADKDIECGNASRMKDTVAKYNKMKNSVGDMPNCLKSKIKLSDWSFEPYMKELGKGNYDAATATYKSLAKPNTADKLILDMFHSEVEQNTPLRDGFFGRPCLGAPLFKLIANTKAFKSLDNNLLFKDIEDHMNSNPGSTISFVLIGSVFGGTGASILPNLANVLRMRYPNAKIHCVLMLPYFSYGNTNPSTIAEHQTIAWKNFRDKTATALAYYGNMDDLVQCGNNETKSYIFNSIKLVGSKKLYKSCADTVTGGSSQIHQFLFHDLFAARAVWQAFERDNSGGNKTDNSGDNNRPNIFADASCDVIGPTEFGPDDTKTLRIFTEFVFAIRAYLYPLLHSPGFEKEDYMTKPFGKIKGNSAVDMDKLRSMVTDCGKFSDDFLKFILNIHSDLDHQSDGLDEVKLINYRNLKRMYEALTPLSDPKVGINAKDDLSKVDGMKLSLWDGGHIHRPRDYTNAWIHIRGYKGANAEECFKAIVRTFYEETKKLNRR